EVAGFDALGLDVRVEGGGLVIGAHGDRHTAASCNICPDSLGKGFSGLVSTVVDAPVAAVYQWVKDVIEAVSVAQELGQLGVVGGVAEAVDLVQGEVVGGHAGGHVQHSATANCGQLCPVTDHGHVRIVAVGQFQECSGGFLV